MIQESHAKLKTDKAGRVRGHRSTHDRHETFVKRHWTFIFHQSFEDIADAVGVSSLWCCLQTTL